MKIYEVITEYVATYDGYIAPQNSILFFSKEKAEKYAEENADKYGKLDVFERDIKDSEAVENAIATAYRYGCCDSGTWNAVEGTTNALLEDINK